MVKCESCAKELCGKKYENRKMCKDPRNCSCTCQEEASTTFWKGFTSVALGAAAFAGGVVLTVSTGGLGAAGIAAVIGGGALTGAGATAAIHPVAKQMSGERMTGDEYATDVLIGGAAGAVTGPIGLGGASATSAIASKVGTEGLKKGVVTMGCRVAVGAASGATTGIIQEAASNDAEFKVTNVFKSAALGAVTGGAGHVTSSITGNINSGVARSVTKVVADTASTLVIDGATQLITEGEIDGKRLALNVGARAATTAGYEAVAGATYKAHGGKEALKDKLHDKQMLKEVDEADRKAIQSAKHQLESMDVNDVKKELITAFEATEKQEELKTWREVKARAEMQFGEAAFAQDREEMLTLRKAIEDINGEVTKCKQSIPKPTMIGNQHIHALNSNHIDQFAADLPDPNNEGGARGARRVLFDAKWDRDTDKFRFKISGIIENHDYNGAPSFCEVTSPELKVVEPFLLPEEDDDDEDKKKKIE